MFSSGLNQDFERLSQVSQIACPGDGYISRYDKTDGCINILIIKGFDPNGAKLSSASTIFASIFYPYHFMPWVV